MRARKMNSSLMKETESLLGFFATYQTNQIHRSYFVCRTKQTNKKKKALLLKSCSSVMKKKKNPKALKATRNQIKPENIFFHPHPWGNSACGGTGRSFFESLRK